MKMSKTAGWVVAVLGLALAQAYAEDVAIGFEAAEDYTAGDAPPTPWLSLDGNGATTDQVRVSSAQYYSGSQSLSVLPDSYDRAVYPVLVQSNQTACFTVWIRPANHVNNEEMGAVSVLELAPNDYWYANCGVTFNANIFAEPEDGTTLYNLTFADGYTARHVGDFTPETWYPVECKITPSHIVFTVTVDTGTYTNAFPRTEGYKVTEIRLHGRQFAIDPIYLGAEHQIVYFDDFSYTPPEMIPFVLLEDFESYGNGYLTLPWTMTPGFLGRGVLTSIDANTNTYATGDWEDFADGAQRPMPFAFDTTQDEIYFQFTGRIKVPLPDWYGWGSALLSFYDEAATNSFFDFGLFQNNLAASTSPQCMLWTNGVAIAGDILAVNETYEFRAKIDWTHQNAQGEYGVFTLLRRPKGGVKWTTDSVLDGIELNVTDPTQIKRLGIRVDHAGMGGYVGGEMDDIYYYAPEPPPPVTLSVASELGSPSPAVGLSTNAYSTVVTCSVEPVTSGLTNYSCIGWTGTGSVPTSGTSNAVAVALTEDSSITWLWQTNYWLDVNVAGNGSVSHPDGWYTKDSEQTLAATPDAGWLFMGWSGDASGTNSAVVTMDEPKVVMAVFSDDADDDGLTNAEEATIGSNPWMSDTDDDGFDDAFEVAQGMSPTNSNSAVVGYIANHPSTFALYPSNAVLDVAVGQMLMETDGGSASLYLQLEQSDDLITWTNAGDAVEWSISVDGDKQYFRVRGGE